VNDIEKRSQLAQIPGPEEHQWGECFIAVRDGDMVHTLSGNACEFELELEQDDVLNFSTNRIWGVPAGDYIAHIRFRDKVVQELRPFDGGIR
jgi:hypothetical protein